MTTITLSDQASFTKFFKQFVAGEIADDVTIEFKPPKIVEKKPFLQIEGDEYNGTINTLMMDILQIHQTNIHRLYSLVKYGKVTKLKASEVESLRIIFQVNAGSSIITIKNLAKITGFIISALINPERIGELAVGLILIFTVFMLDNYRDKKNRKFIAEEKQKDRDFVEKEKKKEIDFAAEETKKEIDFILKFVKENPEVNKAFEGNKEFLEKITKLSKHADVVKYLGHPISPVVKKKDKKNLPIQLNGNYKIRRLNTKKKNYFEVRVENILTGGEFNARLSAGTNHENMQSIISKAYFSGGELYLNIDAFLSGNKLEKARIVSIGEKITPSYQTTNN